MRILIFGGTRFLGVSLVQAALNAGHEVTLFNRGISNPSLFPEVEKITGDREIGDYDGLEGRTWDAALDIPTDDPLLFLGNCTSFEGRLWGTSRMGRIMVQNI